MGIPYADWKISGYAPYTRVYSIYPRIPCIPPLIGRAVANCILRDSWTGNPWWQKKKNDLFQIEPYSYCVKIPTVRLLKSSLCWGDRLDTMKVVLLKHSILVMQDRAISPSVKNNPKHWTRLFNIVPTSYIYYGNHGRHLKSSPPPLTHLQRKY